MGDGSVSMKPEGEYRVLWQAHPMGSLLWGDSSQNWERHFSSTSSARMGPSLCFQNHALPGLRRTLMSQRRWSSNWETGRRFLKEPGISQSPRVPSVLSTSRLEKKPSLFFLNAMHSTPVTQLPILGHPSTSPSCPLAGAVLRPPGLH